MWSRPWTLMISFVFGSCQRTDSVHLSTAIGITQDSELLMRISWSVTDIVITVQSPLLRPVATMYHGSCWCDIQINGKSQGKFIVRKLVLMINNQWVQLFVCHRGQSEINVVQTMSEYWRNHLHVQVYLLLQEKVLHECLRPCIQRLPFSKQNPYISYHNNPCLPSFS